MSIPFVDLRVQHDEVRAELDAALAAAIDGSTFIGGRPVASFEDDFAAYCGVDHAVAVSSGTDALYLTLRALGVGPGDVVITVPNSFIATVEAIVQCGAEVRFVDVEPVNLTMSGQALEQYLVNHCRVEEGSVIESATGQRVAAVIPVHLYGLPADMDAILTVAGKRNIKVVEDACQAHGASYASRTGCVRVGQQSDAACFSFYPAKNLGAMGDAGAVVTHDSALAKSVRLLADHGQDERYHHITPFGVNARMDAIQAAVLGVKLTKLDTWNAKRRQVAKWYREQLDGVNLSLPAEPPGRHHVYHLFVIRHPERDALQRYLNDNGVGTGLHYPVPLHRQPALAHLDLPVGAYPEAESAAREVLSLPMYPGLSSAQVSTVASRVREFLFGA